GTPRRAASDRAVATARASSCGAWASVPRAPRLATHITSLRHIDSLGPVALRGWRCWRLGPEAELLPYPRLDGGGHRRMLAQEVARVLASLTDALAVVGVPRARLLDDAVLRGDVEQLALPPPPHALQ